MVQGPGGDFAEIAAFAASMTEWVEAEPDHPGEAFELRTSVLREAAELVERARAEVSFGMFAESSAGKSLLVGTLLGDPLLLPVFARTSTCNVTVLRLHPVESRRARITQVRVEYLDTEGLDGYTGHLRDVIATGASTAGGDGESVRALPPSRDSLPRMREILAEAGALRLAPNEEATLRGEVDDMLAGIEALAAAGFAPGDVEEITPAELPLVLDHGEPGARAEGPAARRSMVRRVRVDVEVPATMWGAKTLHGALLHLVDVPGSSSGRRPVRDDYLRIRELDAVDTALFFLESRPSSVQDARKLQDLMSRGRRDPATIRESVLVVAGKFDALDQAPGVLLDPATGFSRLPVPPGEGDLLAAAPTLRDLVTTARELVAGRDDRIFFVSPFATMALADELNLGWNALEVAGQLHAGQEVDTAGRRVREWRTVGSPRSPLGRALNAFTVDGGLAALQTAMIAHADAHGITQRLRQVRVEAERLRGGVERLRALRVQLGPVVTADADVRELFERGLGNIARRLGELREIIPLELADPTVAGPHGSSTADRLRQDVEHEVYEWPQWRPLFDAVEYGMVTAVATVDDFEDIFGQVEERTPVPIMVNDLVAPFVDTCLRIRGRNRDRVMARVAEFLRAADLVTAEEADRLDQVMTPAIRGRVGPAPWLVTVDALRAVTPLLAGIEKTVTDRPQPAPNVVESSFPLDPTRSFPWHPESRRRDRPDYCGAPVLLRLRGEMTAAVAADCERALGELQNAAAERLVAALAAATGRLNPAVSDSARWIEQVEAARAAAGRANDEEGTR